MPVWFDQLRQRLLGPRTPAEPVDEAPMNSSYRESPPPPTPPVKPTLSLGVAIWRLGPYIVLGVGLLMTIFAERLHSWGFLGFLLLTSAPILFALRRIEELVRELIEVNKLKRTR